MFPTIFQPAKIALMLSFNLIITSGSHSAKANCRTSIIINFLINIDLQSVHNLSSSYVYIISENSIKIKLFLSNFSFRFAFYTLEKAAVSRVSLLSHITTKRTSTFLIPWRHNCDSNADYQKVGHLSRVLR